MAHALLLAAVAAALATCACGLTATFDHGIASGDPLPDGIIIWTRVTPRVNEVRAPDNFTVSVDWSVSTAADLSAPVAEGVFETNGTRDWTVKVDVRNLASSVQYYYGFSVDGVSSTIGTFRLPKPAGESMEQLKYAVFACSNWGFGYFNAYDLASRYDLDFHVHLGDFIYEYDVGTYPSAEQAVRFAQQPKGLTPVNEIVSLDDYRKRYALYRADPALQVLSAKSPLIAVWDDHEITNNPWTDGAENHDPDEGEGDWVDRWMTAVRVYHEWMPIRSLNAEGEFIAENINRSFQFGDLATLIIIETRLTGRTRQDEGEEDSAPNTAFDATLGLVAQLAPEDWEANNVNPQLEQIRDRANAFRTRDGKKILGDDQLSWVQDETQKSLDLGTKWQLYGSPSVMQDLLVANFDAALEQQTDPETKALWEESLFNVTHPNMTFFDTSGLAHFKPLEGKPLQVPPGMLAQARAALALGRYGITIEYDGWQGYVADRDRFLCAIENATNAVVYSGDYHASYAGVLKKEGETVAPEFVATSVTSAGWPSFEPYRGIPPQMLNDAWSLANKDMLYANLYTHGLNLVTLTPGNQHLEILDVNIDHTGYTAVCDVAFDYAANNGAPSELVFGNCDPIPEGTPYSEAWEISLGVGRSASLL